MEKVNRPITTLSVKCYALTRSDKTAIGIVSKNQFNITTKENSQL